MKKILLLGLVLVFNCQEPLPEIQPKNIEGNELFSIDIDYFEGATEKLAASKSYSVSTTATVSPTITAGGINDYITITGSGFGTEKGRVVFTGGYASANMYISEWTDTKIVAEVPSNAYTGRVQVRTVDNNTILATTDNVLTVKYGINAGSFGTHPVTQYAWYRAAHVKTEIIWHAEVGTSQSLKDRFQQALQVWKCATGINWRLGEDTNADANSNIDDGLYIFGKGYSPGSAHSIKYYRQCNENEFYISSTKIVFDEREDYSVVMHEIGHSLGFSHSNNSGSVMSPTANNSSLSVWDKEGGINIVNWSINNTPSCQEPTVSSDCVSLLTYYKDNDGDGYGNPSISTQAESQPQGYVTNSSDCNDSDPNINPNATEILDNGIDEDCDGVAQQTPTYFYYKDNDGDGFGGTTVIESKDNTVPEGYSRLDGDCNDSDPNINPDAYDTPRNGIDEDCDGKDAKGKGGGGNGNGNGNGKGPKNK